MAVEEDNSTKIEAMEY